MTVYDNRYRFHWLPAADASRFAEHGVLEPSWTHYLVEQGAFVKGICAAFEPMLWAPDDGLPGEACLVLDTGAFDFASTLLDSSAAYHLTKRLRNVRKADGGLERALEAYQPSPRPDEEFFTTSIPWAAVASIGCVPGSMTAPDLALCEATASLHGLPCFDMTGWEIGSPGCTETDALLDEIHDGRLAAARPPGR